MLWCLFVPLLTFLSHLYNLCCLCGLHTYQYIQERGHHGEHDVINITKTSPTNLTEMSPLVHSNPSPSPSAPHSIVLNLNELEGTETSKDFNIKAYCRACSWGFPAVGVIAYTISAFYVCHSKHITRLNTSKIPYNSFLCLAHF